MGIPCPRFPGDRYRRDLRPTGAPAPATTALFVRGAPEAENLKPIGPSHLLDNQEAVHYTVVCTDNDLPQKPYCSIFPAQRHPSIDVCPHRQQMAHFMTPDASVGVREFKR